MLYVHEAQLPGRLLGTLMKEKCLLEAKETHPDILRGGHRNPYQLENAIKSGGPVFCLYKLC